MKVISYRRNLVFNAIGDYDYPAPADVPDSMLSWSAKANYRVDISTAVGEAAMAAAATSIQEVLKTRLLRQYIEPGEIAGN